MLAEALAVVDTTLGSATGRPSCIGSRGSCCWHGLQSTSAEAEACFQQALDVARHQQAKSLELRAAMSLSRLWQQPGQARRSPTSCWRPIYGWFTEGFDTADLQEAKVLLEELFQ